MQNLRDIKSSKAEGESINGSDLHCTNPSMTKMDANESKKHSNEWNATVDKSTTSMDASSTRKYDKDKK